METKTVKIASLLADPANARKHDKKNIDAIKASLKQFGQRKNIVVRDGIIIAGNGTVEAAKQLGWEDITIAVADDMSATEAKAFALADNRTAELAVWDDDVLGEQLQALYEDGYAIADIGFDWEDNNKAGGGGITDDDEVPEVEENVFGVKRGDIWQLGEHRLMCGDSTSKDDVERLMNGEKADMVFTDPPYNAGFQEKEIANDNFKCIEDFLDFMEKWFNLSLEVSKDNSSFYIWGFEKTICELKTRFNKFKLEFCNLIVWDKVSFGRTLPKFKSGKELCLFYKRGTPLFNNQRMKARPSLAERWGHLADANGDVKQGKYNCNIHEGPCTDVWWDIPNMGRGGNKEYLAEHPTQKPLAACERGILASSNIGFVVLDLFLGSGSTLIACEKTGRKCYGMEIDEHYCSVIIKRWQDYTGKEACKTSG